MDRIYVFLSFLSLFFLQKPEISTHHSYKEIYDVVHSYEQNDENALPYIQILIEKAKNEENYWRLYKAYRTAAAYAHEELKLFYADSGVWAANHTKDTLLLGNAFLTKGLQLNFRRKYDQALENYLIAEGYLHKTEDAYSKHKLLFAIGQLKNYLGMYDEALPMIDSANRYYAKLENQNDSSLYLYSLNAMKDIHMDLGNYNKATQLYYQGKSLNTAYQNANIEALLDLYEGYNQYQQQNYPKAIELVHAAMPEFEKKEDFSRTSMADFYLGLCYFDMGENEKGIRYFKKMDSVFVKEHYTRPRFRVAYEKMIQYYQQNNQPKEQLWAVNQLLAVDDKLNSYYHDLSSTLKNKYDTQLLLREKAQLEKDAQAKERSLYFWILGLLALCSIFVFFGIRAYKGKSKFQNLYTNLMEDEKTTESVEERPIENKPSTQKPTSKTQNIPDDVIQDILNKIKVFEDEEGFLDKTLTQRKLAEKLKTNTAYLSNIINEKKGKSFSQYLNHIRIHYIVNILKSEPKYRQYTISSLAEACGYKNAKTFRTAFKEVTGMSAYYFMERIAKEPV